MLEFLQTGKALYVLAAICGLGILTKWLTRTLYRRLIKETDNMSLTKNKNLRAFKQKAESTYQMNQGIPRAKPFVERQMYDFKFLHITFHGWANFSNQMTLWCFLAGGAAAFASYWYRTDPYFIVLYGSVGILAGLLTILVDHGAGITEKKQQLFACLDNYMENHLIYRLDRERRQGISSPEPAAEARDNIRTIYPAAIRSGPFEEEETPLPDPSRPRSRAERMKNQLKTEVQPRTRGEGARPPRGTAVAARETPQPARAERASQSAAENPDMVKTPSSGRNADDLKRGLEQIAAGKERGREAAGSQDLLKELTPEELKLIGEILKEYLT